MFTPTNIHIETRCHSLSHAADTRVMVLLGLSDERHVGIIQIDGIDQWQGLIVEYVDVTREAADISLLGNDLTQVTWTMALAKRAYHTIAWNLGWAFIYNVIGVGLAMAGLLHPVLAAAAMVLSSALVVGNSLRILRY